MQKLPFNAKTLPLNAISLIEASAGTGKTYSMVNIYLRLILGIGITPLAVDEILVVTFTRAATSELKDRIRSKVIELRDIVLGKKETDDPYILYLLEHIEDKNHAELLLKVAANDIDRATIFTIDSFFQQTLRNFAFESGVSFDLEISENIELRRQRLAKQAWREVFYHNFELATLVNNLGKTPLKLLKDLENNANFEEPEKPKNYESNKVARAKYDEQKALFDIIVPFKNKFNELNADYLKEHNDRSFDEMTSALLDALKSDKADSLKQAVRKHYAFAMIDEFQDTSLTQYQIFEKLFLEENVDNRFVMIGDPKQLIYAFRGANVESYFNAKEKAQHIFTLDTNYRSNDRVTNEINTLFNVDNPFIYPQISFDPVQTIENKAIIKGQEAVRYIVSSQTNLSKIDERRNDVAKICANQIAEQLNLGQQSKLTIDDKTVQSEDIAILVADKNQAEMMRLALKNCGIDSIFLSQKQSVFHSTEARELLQILKAISKPNNVDSLMVALFSTIFNKTASDLFQIKNNDALLESYLEKFKSYYQKWQQDGILAMLYMFFFDEKILLNLIAQPFGDRAVTNLLHLSELLQQESKNLDPTALLSWFEQTIKNAKENQEDQIIRLESEQKLVKIVTYHGSKGLEYPIVWLPFISTKDSKKSLSDEDLRVLYVAMTRAKSQLNIVLSEINSFYQAGKETAFYYLQNNISNNHNLNGKIIYKDSNENIIYQANSQQDQQLSIKIFDKKIIDDFSFSSFTSLINTHNNLSNFQKNKNVDHQHITIKDHDNNETNEIIYSLQNIEKYSPLTLKKGAQVGSIIHNALEFCNFSNISNRSIEQLRTQLSLDENWQDVLKQWFENIVTTPLIKDKEEFTLANIPYHHTLRELDFHLSFNDDNALNKLNELINTHTDFSCDLQLPEIKGILKGSIDLVLCFENKFYIVDYKSNYLGNTLSDYSLENLTQTIEKSHYYLQYIIYSLALHRYLKIRKYDYNIEQDLGGIFYLFLRAMNKEAASGVYFTKLSKEFIEELDKIFQ